MIIVDREDEFAFDPQDDYSYDIDQRDYYLRYLNKYGDITYIKHDVPDLNSRSTNDFNKCKEFYKAQKDRFWDGNQMANFPGEYAKFYLHKKLDSFLLSQEKKQLD